MAPFRRSQPGTGVTWKCAPSDLSHFLTFRSECMCFDWWSIRAQHRSAATVNLSNISLVRARITMSTYWNLIMEEAVPFSIVSTVKALSGALRRDADHEAEISREREKLWFKESSAKNLRNRDFLSPNTVLTTMYAGGEVSLKYVLTCAFYFLCYDLFLACPSDRCALVLLRLVILRMAWSAVLDS